MLDLSEFTTPATYIPYGRAGKNTRGSAAGAAAGAEAGAVVQARMATEEEKLEKTGWKRPVGTVSQEGLPFGLGSCRLDRQAPSGV